MKPAWTAGKCCREGCPFTMVAPIGAGMYLCWAHYIAMGLPLGALVLLASCGGLAREPAVDSSIPDAGVDAVVIEEAIEDSAPPIDSGPTCGWRCVVGAPWWVNTCDDSKCYVDAGPSHLSCDVENPCAGDR